MKLKTAEVKTAFGVLDNVPANPLNESSNFVRFRVSGGKLTLSLTGVLWAEASVVGEGEGKWTAYVERRALKAFLETVSSPVLEMFYKDKLLLRGDQRLEIASRSPISGYETWEPKGARPVTDELLTLLKVAVKYLPDTPGREHVEAVYLDPNKGLLSSDTIFIFHSPTLLGEEVLIPREVAGVLVGGGKIATDGRGVGGVLEGGVVFQPLSSELDRFPRVKGFELIAKAGKAPRLFQVPAEELLATANTAARFLLDKADEARVEPTKTGVQIGVETGAGVFRRALKAAQGAGLKTATGWPLKRLLPWIAYAASGENVVVEYAQFEGGVNVLRAGGKTPSMLIFPQMVS